VKAPSAAPAGAEPALDATNQLKAGAAAALSLMLTDEEKMKEALAKKKESSS
jgi:hypothetical protein